MKQRGFSSVLLIAIIVLLASMSAVAIRFVATTQGHTVVQMQWSKVNRAAETALEWQRYQIRSNPACAASSNVLIPFSTGNVQVTVTCQRNPAGVTHTEGANNYFSYTITAIACHPAVGGACPDASHPFNYVERRLTAVAVCPSTRPINPVVADCTW